MNSGLCLRLRCRPGHPRAHRPSNTTSSKSTPPAPPLQSQAFASASAASPATKTSALSAEAKKRAKAAVLGGLVADAATMPLHRIDDVSGMWLIV